MQNKLIENNNIKQEETKYKPTEHLKKCPKCRCLLELKWGMYEIKYI